MTFPSRFRALSPAFSALLLAAMMLITLFSAVGISPPPPHAAKPKLTGIANMSDRQLYGYIIEDMQHGKSYYQAVAFEHRRGHYPLKPFLTVRLPTLAWVSATLGTQGTFVALIALLLTTLLTWFHRMEHEQVDKRAIYASTVTMAASAIILLAPTLSFFHEAWAALLIALSLALWNPNKVWPSLIAGLAAALIREMALAYLFLMIATALYERQPREALKWLIVLGIAALFLYVHALHVNAIALPSDGKSGGWMGMRGWSGFIRSCVQATPFFYFPVWLGRAFMPLCLFGWASWNTSIGLRTAGMLGGFTLMMMLFGREDNFYWGLLLTPLFASGLVFACLALWQLVKQLRPARVLTP